MRFGKNFVAWYVDMYGIPYNRTFKVKLYYILVGSEYSAVQWKAKAGYDQFTRSRMRFLYNMDSQPWA